MNALGQQFDVSLRLHFRNTLALLYSYLFPTIFLIAFWVLYRFEQVPLARHMGELLTVTVLGGACFGLPTSMVSERERGVWRRYRLAPVAAGTLVASTISARYVLLVTAGMLQLVLAMAIGMPAPVHPLGLAIVFTLVAFAFVGLGLVIAMLADNVPAVQALGQVLFLPMLIIGGVAVRLESLPDWAQHLSAFFPGRYAVAALQDVVTGEGLDAQPFNLLALVLIGVAGCLAAAKMFRWDARERFITREGKAWLGVALAAWVGVGLLAEWRGLAIPGRGTSEAVSARSILNLPSPPGDEALESPTPAPPPTPMPAPPASRPAFAPPDESVDAAEGRPRDTGTGPEPGGVAPTPSPAPTPTPAPPPTPEPSVSPGNATLPASNPGAGARPGGPADDSATATAPPAPPPPGAPATRWQDVTAADIARDLTFDRLPPDDGIVAPLAGADDIVADADAERILNYMAIRLPTWPSGQVTDPVQRLRNFLFVAAVPDVFQMETLEPFVPWVVYEQIQNVFAVDDLVKLLYWVATHPDEGDDSAVDQLRYVGLGNGPSDMEQTRERVTFYALKLLGRLTGEIQ